MYEEPYRWIEAVENRRQYVADQLRRGSPIIALSCQDGILLLTLNRGTPKLYEIYDRIALGGMGHPADLEKLRFQLLDMAHLEGFNRSPSDVTGARLLKYGLAPTLKQAFEEIFKAPFLIKLLLVELGRTKEQDQFLTIDYDGSFHEAHSCVVLAGHASIQAILADHVVKQMAERILSLKEGIELGMRTWAMGDLLQRNDGGEHHDQPNDEISRKAQESLRQFADDDIIAHLRETLSQSSLECGLLDRTISGKSKYRMLSSDELTDLLPFPVTLTR
ncbi:MAG: hypothetical protein MRJ96_16230 [Nitrospirales bacterium]|nr:hypothetical protein [Nitrospira sp.]MDR4502992.1 hypothetical protein [Nitrospirales bacterium]